jgi:hypothetical protein
LGFGDDEGGRVFTLMTPVGAGSRDVDEGGEFLTAENPGDPRSARIVVTEGEISKEASLSPNQSHARVGQNSSTSGFG